MGHSAFTAAGIGLYVLDPKDFDANGPGGALLLGGGYEFARHWQIGGYLSFGRTTSASVDFDHATLSVLINAIAF